MSVFASNFVTFADGTQAPRGALTLGAVRATLERYKRTIAKRYRIISPDDIAKELPAGPLYISTKVDGELWFLLKHAGEVALASYNGRMLMGIPVCREAEAMLAGVEGCVIAGELFALAQTGRPRVHNVARALRDPQLAGTIGFKVFDIVESDGKDWQLEPYAARYEAMTTLFAEGQRCSVVTTVQAERDEAVRRYDEWVPSKRFEGLVVRSEQGLTYKIKPAITIDAVVIAFGERTEGDVTVMRELQLALRRDDGSYHVLGPVGGGFSDDDRAGWHARLSEMAAPSAYRMANRDGTLCRFVRPEIVVEIRCADLLATDTADEPARRMTLAWVDAEGWSPLSVMPMPSLIHPVFIRERADKPPDTANIGLEQVYTYIPFEQRDAAPERTELADAEILDRRVWTKKTKDRVAVRKLVVWATHKHTADPNYPPFVIAFTDFSAGRKEPLQTTLRVASSHERAMQHVDAWIADRIKRGWEPVDAG